jgi:hypothetical protein
VREFDEILELRSMITEIDERIEMIKSDAMSPHSQSMSSFSGTSTHMTNPLENYITRQEEYEARRKRLISELEEKWNAIDSRMDELQIDKSHRMLMYFRFNRGLSWKESTEKMKKIEGDIWNENRSFRYYRKVLSILQKNELKFVQNDN